MDNPLMDFISEHKEDLYDEFIKSHESEFKEMLKQEIIDEERDLNYWKDIFCKEEMEEDFNNYCEQEYNNLLDVIQTDNSYRNR